MKTLIQNLENELVFLKEEMKFKNKIIENLLAKDLLKHNNQNIPSEGNYKCDDFNEQTTPPIKSIYSKRKSSRGGKYT